MYALPFRKPVAPHYTSSFHSKCNVLWPPKHQLFIINFSNNQMNCNFETEKMIYGNGYCTTDMNDERQCYVWWRLILQQDFLWELCCTICTVKFTHVYKCAAAVTKSFETLCKSKLIKQIYKTKHAKQLEQWW